MQRSFEPIHYTHSDLIKELYMSINNLDQVLKQILRRLEYLNLPIISQLREGINDRELDKLEEKLPFKLPQEVRFYYQWRNGYRASLQEYDLLFPSGRVLSLQDGIDDYQQLIELNNIIENDILAKNVSATPDPYSIFELNSIWDPFWLPIFNDISNSYHAIVCAKSTRATSPVYSVSLEDSNIYLAYDSLTTLFQTVINAYETGAYYFDDGGIVCCDRAKLLPIENAHNPRRREYLLKMAGNARDLTDVIKVLADPDPDMSAKAAHVLMLLGEARISSLVIQQLYHEKPLVRDLAARVLGVLGDLDSAQVLEQVAESDPEEWVQQSAQYALRQLDNTKATLGS